MMATRIPRWRFGEGGVVGYTTYMSVVFAANSSNRNRMHRPTVDEAFWDGIERQKRKLGTAKVIRLKEAASRPSSPLASS